MSNYLIFKINENYFVFILIVACAKYNEIL